MGPVYRIGVAILSAVGETEADRIIETGPGPVEEFGDETEGPYGLGPHPLHPQEFLEVLGLSLIG